MTTRGQLARSVLLLAVVVAMTLGAVMAPAQAAGKHPPANTHAYSTSDSPCYTSPNAYDGRAAAFKPLLGTLYAVSKRTVKGVDALNGETDFRWVEVDDGRGCWQPSGWLSQPLDAAKLDVATFTGHAIVAPPAEGLGIGAALSAADRAVNAAPALDSTTLGELEDGDVVATRDGVIVQAQRGLAGPTDFRAVEYEGQLGWMLASSLAEVPALSVEDLTATITPEWDVNAQTLPGAGEVLGTLAAGTAVTAGVSSTAGWLPVEVDGQVGWVSQTDLNTDPQEGALASAEPTETFAERIERLQEEAREKLAEREQAGENVEVAEPAEAGEPGLWGQLKAKVTGENPAAEALAAARLKTAGWLLVLTLVLTAGAHAATVWLRGRSRAAMITTLATMPVVAVVAHASFPAAVTAAWVTTSVAPSSYFQSRVLFGAAVVAVLLAWVGAHRLGVYRRADTTSLMSLVVEKKTLLALAAAVGGLAAYALFEVPIATAVVFGALAAGTTAGLLLPRTGAGTAQATEQEPSAPLTSETEHPAKRGDVAR